MPKSQEPEDVLLPLPGAIITPGATQSLEIHLPPGITPPRTIAERIDRELKGEVLSQCYRARIAGSQLSALIHSEYLRYNVADPMGRQAAVLGFITEVWNHIHTILSAGATVSRILFPKPPPPVRPDCSAPSMSINRARAASARAKEIWKTWPLPHRKKLRPLWRPATRNAMEHVENGAPEWFAEQGRYPLLSWAIVGVPDPTKLSAKVEAFRLFDQDNWRVKVGDSNCSLKALLESLKEIEDSLPARGGIELLMIN